MKNAKGSASIADTLKRWRQEGEAIERGLRERLQQLKAEELIIERSLANFGEKPERVVKSRKAKSEAPAKAEPADKGGQVPEQLQELRPWWGVLSGKGQIIVKQRASGKMPGEIAAALKMTPAAVSTALWNLTKKLVAARQGGADPQAKDAGGDNDEEPDGAEESNPSPPAQAAPAPAADILDYGPRLGAIEQQLRAAAPIPAPMHQNASPVDASPAVSDEQLAEFNRTPLAKIRRIAKPQGDGRVRSKTIAPHRLTRDEHRLAELLVYPEDVQRPACRSECMDTPRPCPFVSCSHHLFLDVNPETGAIKLNFPHLEVWEMAETCSLDVADRGGITLEEVGAILNLTRERIRQVEVRGLTRIRDNAGGELELPDEQARDRI